MRYVSGNLRVPYEYDVVLFRSHSTVNVGLVSPKKRFTSFQSSSTDAATRWMGRPSFVRRRFNISSDGISSRQGAHHVAQKFNSTHCPLYWVMSTVGPPSPCGSFTVGTG